MWDSSRIGAETPGHSRSPAVLVLYYLSFGTHQLNVTVGPRSLNKRLGVGGLDCFCWTSNV